MSKPLLPPSAATHTTSPHNNDVLCGRGGTINAHPGNEQYRKFVERKKRVYLTARFKREKRLIASSIVEEVRNLSPPGRFLTKDPHSDVWYDVGDEKARDKTSQALRENALSVRKQMEEEFQETRRQQAREVAIAAGRDPDEAVNDMMSAVTSLGRLGKKKDGAHGHGKGGRGGAPLVIPPGQPGQPQPGRHAAAAVAGAAGGFVGRSGYGPLYDAQQPAPPRASAWAYHGAPHGHGAPPPPGHHPATYASHAQHHPPPTGPSPPPPPGHFPPAPRSYYQPPPHPPHGMQPPPPHQPQAQQPPYYPSHPPQPPPPHRLPHSYPPYGGWPNPQPPHQPPTAHHPPPPPQPPQPQHTISLQPRRAGASPPRHGASPPTLPPHPLLPGPTPVVVGGAAAAPPPGPASAIRAAEQPPAAADRDRHVQFQKAALVATPPAPAAAPPAADIPLVISSKKKSHPRSGRRTHRESPRRADVDAAVADPAPSSPSGTTTAEERERGANLSLSPQSRGDLSRAAMSTHTDGTGLTPLTFRSEADSARTTDSLSHYLRGIEDEISGDVGQEVELVAHAPVTERRRDHRGGNMYSRSTPPRHHLSVGTGGSQKSSSSSRHSRRRKRRSGNHIPSNSGKVQVDWSSATATPAAAAGGTAGAAAMGPPAPVGSSGVKASLACGSGDVDVASASCGVGVILPTPLRSSNNGPNRSPKTSAMAPPPSGMPPLPTTPGAAGQHGSVSHMSPGAPMSPVDSLDLERMSLCGTENVSQTGGSIGGASLCNVFDDHEDSVMGPSALMDMTMSIGSRASSGAATNSSGGGAADGMPAAGGAGNSPIMGLHSAPLGLSPQVMFGDDRSAGGSALMDMSVGSGANSKENSGGSSRGSSGRSKSSNGRGSPASIDKADLKVEQEQQQFTEDGREMPPPPAAAPMQMYAHDFKFTWDGKREE